MFKESANLNSLKWYGSKIKEGEKDYFANVNIITNYTEKIFDSITFLIRNFNFGGEILIFNFYILILLIIIL